MNYYKMLFLRHLNFNISPLSSVSLWGVQRKRRTDEICNLKEIDLMCCFISFKMSVWARHIFLEKNLTWFAYIVGIRHWWLHRVLHDRRNLLYSTVSFFSEILKKSLVFLSTLICGCGWLFREFGRKNFFFYRLSKIDLIKFKVIVKVIAEKFRSYNSICVFFSSEFTIFPHQWKRKNTKVHRLANGFFLTFAV